MRCSTRSAKAHDWLVSYIAKKSPLAEELRLRCGEAPSVRIGGAERPLSLAPVIPLIVHDDVSTARDLAEALVAVAALSPAARAAMGAAGRDWVGREFSPDRYRERTLKLYEAIS